MKRNIPHVSETRSAVRLPGQAKPSQGIKCVVDYIHPFYKKWIEKEKELKILGFDCAIEIRDTYINKGLRYMLHYDKA